MTRRTSVEAFNEIKRRGLLSPRRWEIYNILSMQGEPMTAGEVFQKSQELGRGHTVVKGSVCARLTEMRELGVVKEAGESRCKLTHAKAILWNTTNELPLKARVKKAGKRSDKKIIKDQENLIKQLKRQKRNARVLGLREAQGLMDKFDCPYKCRDKFVQGIENAIEGYQLSLI